MVDDQVYLAKTFLSSLHNIVLVVRSCYSYRFLRDINFVDATNSSIFVNLFPKHVQERISRLNDHSLYVFVFCETTKFT